MSEDIDFTQTRRPKSRFNTFVRVRSHKPKNRFGDPEYVFMHVGKTGGTSINAFFHDCHNKGLRVPIVLNHNWSFQMARARHPKAKIILVLRDPLERIVSGFNSRLREGRPLGHPWNTEEAIAFGHFKSVEKFIAALSSDEAYEISAARFCFLSIGHIRRGYRYLLGDIEEVTEASVGPLYVRNIEEIEESIPEIIALLNPQNKDKILDLSTLHKASVSSSSFLDSIPEETLKKIHSRMRLEYNAYNMIRNYLGNS